MPKQKIIEALACKPERAGRVTVDNEVLQSIAHNPIEIDGKTIDPAKEPELFLHSLYLIYHSPYFDALKAVWLPMAFNYSVFRIV